MSVVKGLSTKLFLTTSVVNIQNKAISLLKERILLSIPFYLKCFFVPPDEKPVSYSKFFPKF